MAKADIEIEKWPQSSVSGAKRANAYCDGSFTNDWFVGYGKESSCHFEGTWWDLICFARNVLASENTKLVAPQFHRPDWANNNYGGEERPYDMKDE